MTLIYEGEVQELVDAIDVLEATTHEGLIRAIENQINKARMLLVRRVANGWARGLGHASKSIKPVLLMTAEGKRMGA
jgi:hypothetical protein